tara:strand:+ start:9661 stop:10242 length:582 start_codon:yes stop_codon:yes gene_type:complete
LKQKKINAAGGVVFRYNSFEMDSFSTSSTNHDFISPSIDATESHSHFSIEQSLEILLIRRNGLWDIPKGKVEKNEQVAYAARREVQEEVGLVDPIITHFICTTNHEYEQKNKRYHKTTYWYGMIDAKEYRAINGINIKKKTKPIDSMKFRFIPQVEEGITDVRWVDILKAQDWVAFDNLREVLSLLTEQITGL